jgi:hypothetical protein
MMSELTFGSNSDKALFSDNFCSSTIEVDQLDKLRIDGTAIQNETYCIELLRRVTLYSDQDAWKIVQDLLSETVRGWISQHPRKEKACSLESEENYVAEAFARFYLLIIHQQMEFSQLSTALQYLKVCLNGAILNRLRAFSRPPVIPLPAPDGTSKQNVAGSTDTVIVWEILKETLPNAREQRLVYLLFHCGLSPKKIVNTYPREFQDVQEISCLRQSIFELLLHRLDQLDDLRATDKEVNTTRMSSEGLDKTGEE